MLLLREKATSLLDRLFRFISGVEYDIFISYKRGDSDFYATKLAAELARKKYRTYFDQYVRDIGQGHLPLNLKKAARHSRMLVILGTENCGRSPSMAEEIEHYHKRKRKIVVPVDFDDLKKQSWFSKISDHNLVKEKKELLDDGTPSSLVLETIDNTFKYRKRNAILQRNGIVFLGIVAVLAIVIIAWTEKKTAASRREIKSNLLASKSLMYSATNFDTAAALARDAIDISINDATITALFNAYWRKPFSVHRKLPFDTLEPLYLIEENTLLLLADEDKIIRYDYTTNEIKQTEKLESKARIVDVNRDHKTVLFQYSDHSFEVFSNSRRQKVNIPASSQVVVRSYFQLDSNLIVADSNFLMAYDIGELNKGIRVFDIRQNQFVRNIPFNSLAGVYTGSPPEVFHSPGGITFVIHNSTSLNLEAVEVNAISGAIRKKIIAFRTDIALTGFDVLGEYYICKDHSGLHFYNNGHRQNFISARSAGQTSFLSVDGLIFTQHERNSKVMVHQQSPFFYYLMWYDPLFQLDNIEPTTWMGFDHNNSSLVTVCNDNTIRIWKLFHDKRKGKGDMLADLGRQNMFLVVDSTIGMNDVTAYRVSKVLSISKENNNTYVITDSLQKSSMEITSGKQIISLFWNKKRNKLITSSVEGSVGLWGHNGKPILSKYLGSGLSGVTEIARDRYAAIFNEDIEVQIPGFEKFKRRIVIYNAQFEEIYSIELNDYSMWLHLTDDKIYYTNGYGEDYYEFNLNLTEIVRDLDSRTEIRNKKLKLNE